MQVFSLSGINDFISTTTDKLVSILVGKELTVSLTTHHSLIKFFFNSSKIIKFKKDLPGNIPPQRVSI